LLAQWRQNRRYWSRVWFARFWHRLFARLRLEGFDRLPPGPYILAPNHVSHFDAMAVVQASPRPVALMASTEVFNWPVVRWVLRGIDPIPVDRFKTDPGSLTRARERLDRGQIVVMFPEGGIRSGPTSVLEGAPLRGGVAWLAQTTGCPVRPVLVAGSDRYYTVAAWLRRDGAWLIVGEPLTANPELPPKEAREDFNRRLGEAYRALYDQWRARPEVPRSAWPRTAQERWGRA
jgi:1-acyl-sn-glycerol-3-phosphate acyltransferase